MNYGRHAGDAAGLQPSPHLRTSSWGVAPGWYRCRPLARSIRRMRRVAGTPATSLGRAASRCLALVLAGCGAPTEREFVHVKHRVPFPEDTLEYFKQLPEFFTFAKPGGSARRPEMGEQRRPARNRFA